VSEQISKPVAWLHCERPEADVVTDAVKNVWGGVAVGKLAQYSIPLYLESPEQQQKDAAYDLMTRTATSWFDETVELKSLLASALAIAERKGESTNWEAFAARIRKVCGFEIGEAEPTNDGHKLPPSDPIKPAPPPEQGRVNKIGTNMLAYGVTRVADNPRAIMVLLRHEPTDDDLRALHEALRPVNGGNIVLANAPPLEQECEHRKLSYCHGSSLWVCADCDEGFNADEVRSMLEPPEEGMTIKGGKIEGLAEMMQECKQGGPAPDHV